MRSASARRGAPRGGGARALLRRAACDSPRAGRSSGQPYAQALLEILLERRAIAELRQRALEIGEYQRREGLADEGSQDRAPLLDHGRDGQVLFTADDHEREVQADAFVRRI